MKEVNLVLNGPNERVDKLRPIDDTFMKKLGKDKGFCQEMLQVILNKPDLVVIETRTQEDVHNIDTRSVTIDITCKDKDGIVFGVEVQKANDDDHQKRVRYNGSCLQVQSLKKGASFKDLPDVCMIFITESDFLKKGKTIYHIDRTIRETGEFISNGYEEIYVNAQIDDGSDLAEYMKILKSESVCNNSKFPEICYWTNYYKNGKGRQEMCQIVEEYAEEKAALATKETTVQIAIKAIKKNISDVDIADMTGLTLGEISDLRSNL